MLCGGISDGLVGCGIWHKRDSLNRDGGFSPISALYSNLHFVSVSGFFLAGAGPGPDSGGEEASDPGLFTVCGPLHLYVKRLYCRDFPGKLCEPLSAEKCSEIFLIFILQYVVSCKIRLSICCSFLKNAGNTEKIPFDFLGNYHYNTEVGAVLWNSAAKRRQLRKVRWGCGYERGAGGFYCIFKGEKAYFGEYSGFL